MPDNKQGIKFFIFMMIICSVLFSSYKNNLSAEDFIKVPADVQSALFLKLLVFNKELKGDISVYVIDSPDFASEMKKEIGKEIGNAKLSSVKEGSSLPSEKPAVIYLGDESKLNEVISYTRANKVLSITGIPGLVEKGITLGIGVGDNKKPKVLMNLKSSKEESIDWNPAIIKVAKIFE